MNVHEKINYLELPAYHFEETKIFFQRVFDWHFQMYGEDYMAFSNAGIEGGFFRSDKTSDTKTGSVLIVFYSQNLESTQNKIIAAKGKILKPTYEFPGGRRFHFSDPNGNEYAVWSDD